MYLLILFFRNKLAKFTLFTFHNVSINSRERGGEGDGEEYLHSIMYLLIQPYMKPIERTYGYLHSIMYLLIPGGIL